MAEKAGHKITILKPGREIGPSFWFGKCCYCGCEIQAEHASANEVAAERAIGIKVMCPTKNCGFEIECEEKEIRPESGKTASTVKRKKSVKT